MVEGAGLLNQGTPRSDGCVNTWEQQRVDRAPDAIGSREQDTGWHQAAREQEREPTVPRSSTGGERTGARKKESSGEKVWRSEVLKMLAVGMGIGDVTGGGENQVILVDPSTVYLYRLEGGTMSRVAEYSAGSLELKSVDVAKLRKQGPARIYVSAQNRGTISSFVLEYRNGALVPVVQNLPYFLRVIWYPSKGPILLGQRRGLNKIYEGPMFELADKGDDLEVRGRFGVPLKIPIFGFTIGDFEGKRQPLIAVYDREEHLRVYEPSGKRLYVSQDYYGGSDIVLRIQGSEARTKRDQTGDEEGEREYLRPRIMALDLTGDGRSEVLAITHTSKTRRLLSRTKMLEEGQVVGLLWNGDALEERWHSPKVAGMITDFSVDSLPGFPGKRLITFERKKTDWLSFLRSESQVRVYDLGWILTQGPKGEKSD